MAVAESTLNVIIIMVVLFGVLLLLIGAFFLYCFWYRKCRQRDVDKQHRVTDISVVSAHSGYSGANPKRQIVKEPRENGMFGLPRFHDKSRHLWRFDGFRPGWFSKDKMPVSRGTRSLDRRIQKQPMTETNAYATMPPKLNIVSDIPLHPFSSSSNSAIMTSNPALYIRDPPTGMRGGYLENDVRLALNQDTDVHVLTPAVPKPAIFIRELSMDTSNKELVNITLDNTQATTNDVTVPKVSLGDHIFIINPLGDSFPTNGHHGNEVLQSTPVAMATAGHVGPIETQSVVGIMQCGDSDSGTETLDTSLNTSQ